MKRYMFFIDGFNLYHALRDQQKSNREYIKYKWLNLDMLCKMFVRKDGVLSGIKYFTAFAFWETEGLKRHKIYINALESSIENIEVIYGKFKRRTKRCNKKDDYYNTQDNHICDKEFYKHEEKLTDVNIAISLLENAMLDNYDIAIILSADSDLIPPIKAIKRNYPDKEAGVLIPVGKNAEDLKNEADFYMKIKKKHLEHSQFPEKIKLKTGKEIERPSGWK